MGSIIAGASMHCSPLSGTIRTMSSPCRHDKNSVCKVTFFFRHQLSQIEQMIQIITFSP